MRFAGYVIVVAVDCLPLDRERSNFPATAYGGQDLLHHQLTIPAGEILRPLDGLDVILEMLRAVREIRQVPVGQLDEHPLHLLASDFNEVAAHAIAHTARSAVQHEPDRTGFI